MRTLTELSPEKFAEIYTSEEFRNQVAYAHECYDKHHVFMYRKTCSWPAEWISNRGTNSRSKNRS